MSNPFNCNCHLGWMPSWLTNAQIVTGNPRCFFPDDLRDHPVQSVNMESFKCEGMKAINFLAICLLFISKLKMYCKSYSFYSFTFKDLVNMN